jgi:cell division protein FtsI (penicillin-binding protein 3)
VPPPRVPELALRQRRIGWLFGLFALLLALAAARALQLTTFSSGALSSAANAEETGTVVVPAPRGQIVDRGGVILATTASAYDITATPQMVANPATFALELAPILHRSQAGIEQTVLHPSSTRYTILARQVSPAVAHEVRMLKLPAIAVTADPKRVYPGDYLAAQVLGGVGLTGAGLGGVELQYNHALTGTDGVQHVIYDGAGKPIDIASGTTPIAGATVQLTLDAPLQQYVDRVVSQTGEHFKAQSATAIVLNPRTGAILAMSNWPRVNANDPANADAKNYAVGLNYEPGSTFKIVAIGGALSEGLIAPSTRFTIPNCIQVANYCIHDSEYHPTERLSTTQILAQSSNVGAITIAERLGSSALYAWMRRYGFGTPSGVDLPDDEQGIVPPPSAWSGSSIGNLPIGQGVDVTPIQIADAYAAIANGGILRPPHVVRSVDGKRVPLPQGHRILSPVVARELRGMLAEVTHAGGTAAEIHIPGYKLAGKTGTANKAVHGTYSNTDFFASFVGFAPEQHPRIEAIVMVDSPQTGEIYGTEVAAPAWQRIMDFALPLLKIPPG